MVLVMPMMGPYKARAGFVREIYLYIYWEDESVFNNSRYIVKYQDERFWTCLIVD